MQKRILTSLRQTLVKWQQARCWSTKVNGRYSNWKYDLYLYEYYSQAQYYFIWYIPVRIHSMNQVKSFLWKTDINPLPVFARNSPWFRRVAHLGSSKSDEHATCRRSGISGYSKRAKHVLCTMLFSCQWCQWPVSSFSCL